MPPELTIPRDCRETRSDPLISLEEKRSRVVFENPERAEIDVVEVDGCVIREGRRCDYLVIPKVSLKEHFVELKGTKVQTAFDQIERTVRLLSAAPKTGEKCCIVVTTKVPRLGSKVQMAKKRFRKEYRAELVVQNSPYRHRLR